MASSTPKNLAEALIAFQSSVPTIHENDKSFHGKFANLPGVLSTINPALRAAGLTIVQLPDTVDGKPGLRTTVRHVSGESESAVTPLIIADGKNPVHEHGKSLTYIRRYALLAALNLAIGIEDNDCDADLPSASTARQAHEEPVKAAAVAAEDPLSPEEKAQIIGVLKECNAAYRDKVLTAFVKEFGASKAKVSDRIQAVKHNTFFQAYFSANPQ